MSLKTWKEIYYPKPPSKRMTKKAAIEHSLQKWIGLRKSNLKKHGIEIYGKSIFDSENELKICDKSCSLCVKYLNLESKNHRCYTCPLFKSLGESCDNSENGPYQTWYENGNPSKMIKALKALLEEK